jgi:hypothetical protein
MQTKLNKCLIDLEQIYKKANDKTDPGLKSGLLKKAKDTKRDFLENNPGVPMT